MCGRVSPSGCLQTVSKHGNESQSEQIQSPCARPSLITQKCWMLLVWPFRIMGHQILILKTKLNCSSVEEGRKQKRCGQQVGICIPGSVRMGGKEVVFPAPENMMVKMPEREPRGIQNILGNREAEETSSRKGDKKRF